jgi:hypothetical protein
VRRQGGSAGMERTSGRNARTGAHARLRLRELGQQDLAFGANPAQTSLASFREEVILEVFNEAGRLVITYKPASCWPSECQPRPDLDQGANAIAIEHIKLECEGWARDLPVARR